MNAANQQTFEEICAAGIACGVHYDRTDALRDAIRSMELNASASDAQQDPAAIFAIATALYKSANNRNDFCNREITKAYSGMDGFMREAMRVALIFETWACSHVDFDETTDVWPYMLEERFSEACQSVVDIRYLGSFNENHCADVAVMLDLPLLAPTKRRLPVIKPIQTKLAVVHAAVTTWTL